MLVYNIDTNLSTEQLLFEILRKYFLFRFDLAVYLF